MILEQIGPLKSSEPKVIVVEISLIDKFSLYLFDVPLDNVINILGKQRGLSPLLVLEVLKLFGDFQEVGRCAFVQIGHCDSGGKF